VDFCFLCFLLLLLSFCVSRGLLFFFGCVFVFFFFLILCVFCLFVDVCIFSLFGVFLLFVFCCFGDFCICLGFFLFVIRCGLIVFWECFCVFFFVVCFFRSFRSESRRNQPPQRFPDMKKCSARNLAREQTKKRVRDPDDHAQKNVTPISVQTGEAPVSQACNRNFMPEYPDGS